MREDAALQVVVQFAFHIGGQAFGVGIGVERGEKGLQMVGDDVIEHGGASAHMCTIENRRRSLQGHSGSFISRDGAFERGHVEGEAEPVTTSAGAHRKKWTCRTPMALGSGAAPMVSTEPSPAARRCLRPACQHNSGAWKKPPLQFITGPCNAGQRPAGGIQGGPTAGAGRLGSALARRAPGGAARGERPGPSTG